MKQHKQVTSAINQAIISFTFANETFNIDCYIEGIKEHTQMFNALTAHNFYPLHDAAHDAYQFVPYEFWQRDLPMFLTKQAH